MGFYIFLPLANALTHILYKYIGVNRNKEKEKKNHDSRQKCKYLNSSIAIIKASDALSFSHLSSGTFLIWDFLKEQILTFKKVGWCPDAISRAKQEFTIVVLVSVI